MGNLICTENNLIIYNNWHNWQSCVNWNRFSTLFEKIIDEDVGNVGLII